MRGGFRKLIRQARAGREEYGLRYGVLEGARFILERLEHRAQGYLLDMEGARGTLGPAHRRHSLNSVQENREHWSTWDWSTRGEEWTRSEEWKRRLRNEVLEPNIATGGTVLEIGPGAGRWTFALRDRAAHLILVDLTDTTLQLCRTQLGDEGVDYICNDGRSLPGIADGSVDSVWSWDTFVHIAPLDIAAYLSELARVLRPGAGGVIHHGGRRDWRGWRSPMSAALFTRLALENGLNVEHQFNEWADGTTIMPYGDVISIIRRPAAVPRTPGAVFDRSTRSQGSGGPRPEAEGPDKAATPTRGDA